MNGKSFLFSFKLHIYKTDVPFRKFTALLLFIRFSTSFHHVKVTLLENENTCFFFGFVARLFSGFTSCTENYIECLYEHKIVYNTFCYICGFTALF